LLAGAPPALAQLVALMLDNCSVAVDAQSARWPAHAIATAGFGQRHLWEDLNLSGRQDVSALLQHYFEPLYRRNTQNLKWKRFLFEELGAARGLAGLRPPGCRHCEEFSQCFSSDS
jgi:nitrogen fixation protein NifQ